MKIMPFPLLWEQSDASMLAVSCLQITLAHAQRLAVSSVKHEVFISSIFVHFFILLICRDVGQNYHFMLQGVLLFKAEKFLP